jgi:solute carrier family 6 amino acid transporter-like protein 5/7/9/14
MTSIYGGFVVFCLLGFMAKQSNTQLKDVVRSGITLAFVSFPAAIAQMPGSMFWSITFFFMLLLLGMDTQFTVVEIVRTAVTGKF